MQTSKLFRVISLFAFPVFLLQGAAPQAHRVEPVSSGGTLQTYQFIFSDPDGWEDLQILNVLINTGLDGRDACYLAFLPTGPESGHLVLVDDAGNSSGPFAGAMALPGKGSIANSRCSISAEESYFFGNQNTAVLSLKIRRSSASRGEVIYTAARDAQGSSGWHVSGLWRSRPLPSPEPVVVNGNPERAIGLEHELSVTVTDIEGVTQIQVINLLVNDGLDGRNGCYLAILPSQYGSMVYLVDDSGSPVGPYAGSFQVPGFGTIQNSQCSLIADQAKVQLDKTTVTVRLPVRFSQDWAGDKVIYAAGRSADGGNTGWHVVGTLSVRRTCAGKEGLRITSPFPKLDGYFGHSVDTAGNRIIVSAPDGPSNGTSIYTFGCSAQTYVSQHRLSISNRHPTQRFYRSAVSSEGILSVLYDVVDQESNALPSLALYHSNGSDWAFEAEKPLDRVFPQRFTAVSESGLRMAISQHGVYEQSGVLRSAIQIYNRRTAARTATIEPPVGMHGKVLALENSRLAAILARNWHDDPTLAVYELEGAAWQLIAQASLPDSYRLNTRLALSGDLVAVTTIADHDGVMGAGSGLVFELRDRELVRISDLRPPAIRENAWFGSHVVANGGQIMSSESGASHLFRRFGHQFQWYRGFSPPDGGIGYPSPLALTEAFAVVGTPRAANAFIREGAVWVYGAP